MDPEVGAALGVELKLVVDPCRREAGDDFGHHPPAPLDHCGNAAVHEREIEHAWQRLDVVPIDPHPEQVEAGGAAVVDPIAKARKKLRFGGIHLVGGPGEVILAGAEQVGVGGGLVANRKLRGADVGQWRAAPDEQRLLLDGQAAVHAAQTELKRAGMRRTPGHDVACRVAGRQARPRRVADLPLCRLACPGRKRHLHNFARGDAPGGLRQGLRRHGRLEHEEREPPLRDAAARLGATVANDVGLVICQRHVVEPRAGRTTATRLT